MNVEHLTLKCQIIRDMIAISQEISFHCLNWILCQIRRAEIEEQKSKKTIHCVI